MKRLLPFIGIGVMVLAGAGVYFGVHSVTNSYLAREHAANTPEPTVSCPATKTGHIITIQKSRLEPEHTMGVLCDTVTITNADEANRLMAFGVHDRHQPYDGMMERELRPGQSFSFTLNRTGTYTVHDHFDDNVKGTFTVTK